MPISSSHLLMISTHLPVNVSYYHFRFVITARPLY